MNEQDCAQLTLYQEDFPASLFPWLESKKERGTTVIYGRKCSELSENLRRLGSLVRTYLESCELPDERFVRTWSVRDTLSPYLILKLRLSEQSTDGKEFSLWRTPAGSDGEGGIMQMYEDKSGHYKLRDQVQEVNKAFWPTPTSCEWKSRWPNSKQQGLAEEVKMWRTPMACDHKNMSCAKQQYLSNQVKMWPTPAARDYRGSNSVEHVVSKLQNGERAHMGQLPNAVMMSEKLYPTPRAQSAKSPSNAPNRQGAPDLQTVAGGQLNPTWVEWLMGFPLGFTEVD